MNKLTLLAAAPALVVLSACAGSQQKQQDSVNADTKFEAKVPAELPFFGTLKRGNMRKAAYGDQSWEALLAEARDADVVFYGEFHNTYDSQVFELALLRALTDDERKPTLVLEMFELDQQRALNRYVTGLTSYETFVSELPTDPRNDRIRLWPKFERDYKPLLDHARENNLPVLAGFCPRYLASRVYREGWETVVASVSPDERTWLPEELTDRRGPYRDKFIGLMSGPNGIHNSGSEAPSERMLNFFTAQVVKDDTMAEVIARRADDYPNQRILAYAGDFHVAEGLGAVERLRWRRPDLKILVISSQRSPAEGRNEGDWLYEIPESAPKDW